MEKKNKVCWNCGNFKAYYEKGFSRFYKTNEGLCGVKKAIVDKHGECEYWRNKYKMRRLRKKCAIRMLNEIVLDIAAIRQILEEEEEENRLDPIPKEKDSCKEESRDKLYVTTIIKDLRLCLFHLGDSHARPTGGSE